MSPFARGVAPRLDALPGKDQFWLLPWALMNIVLVLLCRDTLPVSIRSLQKAEGDDMERNLFCLGSIYIHLRPQVLSQAVQFDMLD